MAVNVRGIDVNGVANIKRAIETYEKTLNKKIGQIATIDQAVIRKAIKGSAAISSYKNMTNRAVTEAKKFTQKLDNFTATLDQLSSKYKTSEQVSGKTSFDSIAK